MIKMAWRNKVLPEGFVKAYPDYYKLKKGKVKKVYRAWKLSKVIKGSKDSKGSRDYKGRKVLKHGKPYELRGRRVCYARCPVCGEFYRKNYRVGYVTRKTGLVESKVFRAVEVYIDCRFHGEHVIDRHYGSEV